METVPLQHFFHFFTTPWSFLTSIEFRIGLSILYICTRRPNVTCRFYKQTGITSNWKCIMHDGCWQLSSVTERLPFRARVMHVSFLSRLRDTIVGVPSNEFVNSSQRKVERLSEYWKQNNIIPEIMRQEQKEQVYLV